MKSKKTIIIYSTIMFISVVFVLLVLEGNHMLRCGVKDDLRINENYLNMNFFQATFRGGYKFRPVSNGMMWIVCNLTRGNLYVFGYMNVLFAALCTTLIFIFTLDCSNSYIVSILASALYVFSRFSYYQITQMLGIMEVTSTILGICTVFLLYKYIESRSSILYYLSILMCFLASLSHERYMTLFPVIIITWFMVDFFTKDKKSIKTFVKPMIAVLGIGIVLLLFKLLVNNIMTGTGGTDVTQTSSLESTINNLKKSIAYLLSVNMEDMDMYLNMISWNNYTDNIKNIVYISNIAIIVIAVVYLIGYIYEKKEQKLEQAKSILMFALSIGALLLISSVTIRVELRWMYFPYVIMVVVLSYMVCRSNVNNILRNIKFIALLIYVITNICFSLYCREYYSNLYYWRVYSVGNDLIDETYGVYEYGMYDKSWIIISATEEENSYSDMMNEFNPYGNYELKLEIINNFDELKGIENVEEKEILFFDAEKLDFINVTNIIDSYYN